MATRLVGYGVFILGTTLMTAAGSGAGDVAIVDWQTLPPRVVVAAVTGIAMALLGILTVAFSGH